MLLLAPGAEARAQRVDLNASVAAAEVYDSNPTFTTGPLDAAWFSQLEPRLDAGYRTRRLEARARYSLASEIYAAPYQELSTPTARQALEAVLKQRVTPEVDLSLDGAYYSAALARDLPVVTGIERGRSRAEAGTLRAGLADRPSRRVEVGAEYTFLHVAQAGVRGDVHTEDLATAWKASRRSTLRGDLVARQISTSAASFTPMVGWSYALGPAQRLSLRVGPRLTAGGVDDVEGDASLRLRGAQSHLELSYVRARTAVPGDAEPVSSDGVSEMGSAVLGAFTATTSSALFYTRGATTRSWGARGDFELRGALTPWLSVFGAYRIAWQRVPAPTRVDTVAHQVLLGVVIGDAIEPGTGRRRGAYALAAAEDVRGERRLP